MASPRPVMTPIRLSFLAVVVDVVRVFDFVSRVSLFSFGLVAQDHSCRQHVRSGLRSHSLQDASPPRNAPGITQLPEISWEELLHDLNRGGG